MKRFFPSLSTRIKKSVLVRSGVLMSFLALLSLASIVISTLIAEDISGRASAVNVSGSLRMLSFRILSEIQQPEKRAHAFASMQQFEERLLGLERFTFAKSPVDAPAALALAGVLTAWQSNMKPLEAEAAAGNEQALRQLSEDIPIFVDQIDAVVRMIEEDLESKARDLRMIQLGMLITVIVISLLTIWMIRNQLMLPLAKLLEAAKKVSQGSFSIRVGHVGEDELGQLGRAFNTMVAEIAHMYAMLEVKVEEKTHELTRTNQSLELLYRTSQQLAAPDLTLEDIRRVLHDIEEALELGHSMICIRHPEESAAHPVIGNLQPKELGTLCTQQRCEQCFSSAELPLMAQAMNLKQSAQPVFFLALGDGRQLCGNMPILTHKAEELSRDQAKILETVGRHISNALMNMRRAEEKHRLAVLEERSVIARELHDSIAQSLSYLKIQVTRLEKHLPPEGDARLIAQELRNGLNTAYRELRELITTFRLRIDERGIHVALQETVNEFGEKLGYPVMLHNELAGFALSANEEMHVIRIIREALSNIERHAHATAASVTLTTGEDYELHVLIQDNGQGFDPAHIPPNHYGTSIMQDRAHILHGQLLIASTAGQGTRIHLSFKPQKYETSTPTP